jgi:hypothetical protein
MKDAHILIATLIFPVRVLCGVAVLGGVFMMADGFKGAPMDAVRGFQGLGLMLLGVICFPSRQHILWRMWAARAQAAADKAAVEKVEAARRAPVARAQAVVPDRTAPTPALYQERVRLDFAVPPPDAARVTSWIGGLPKLPRDVEWPKAKPGPLAEDGPMLFVAQIALADLPGDIWGGMGPRTGSLCFFVDPEDALERVAVLHVNGLLEERRYPRAFEALQPYPILKRGMAGDLIAHAEDTAVPLMKWPVKMTPVEPEKELPGVTFKYRDKDNLAFAHRRTASLSDPAFVPYSWATLIEVVTVLVGGLNEATRIEGTRPDMPEALRKVQDGRRPVVATLIALRSALQKRARMQGFTAAVWDEVSAQLGTILVPVVKREVDSAGAKVYTLLDPVPVLHTLRFEHYYGKFEYLSREIYAANPDRLPEAVRRSFEPVWQFDASFEVGSMGGRVNIAGHVTVGRDDLVCLIELPQSELVGTAWHDLSRWGVFIDPESLAEGRLDRAVGSMTE